MGKENKRELRQGDCIIGVATPPGKGGVGIVRLSGSGSRDLCARLFRPLKGESVSSWESHRALVGELRRIESQEVLDRGLLLYMEEGRSYTGEETVELHCHGSPLLLQQVLEELIGVGARLAEPGEFSRRAFVNGKIDLAMAEGVLEAIEAQNSLALKQAQKKLSGAFSKNLIRQKDSLLDVLAAVEASIDFVEDDLPELEWKKYRAEIEALENELLKLQATYGASQLAREGARVVIAGRTNVGKSSLFNAWLGEARSIVTEVPGTTRDFIENSFEWDEIPIKLIDIAGISQNSNDLVEQVGIESGWSQIDRADLVLFLFDLSGKSFSDDLKYLSAIPKDKVLQVGNKWDLLEDANKQKIVDELKLDSSISAVNGEGLAKLRDLIVSRLRSQFGAENRSSEKQIPGSNDLVLTSLWQKEEIGHSISALKRAQELFNRGTEELELLAAELNLAADHLNRVLGRGNKLEEVLDRLFSRFCIGK